MYEDFSNDKINREFLSNHINEELKISGIFKGYDREHHIIVENCSYYDNLFATYIILGHMWWQNIVNSCEQLINIKKDSTLVAIGTVEHYKSNDATYSIKTTYGLTNCNIIKVIPPLFHNLH